MKLDNNKRAFLALVRAGLWEKETRLSKFEKIDFSEIYKLAEEQSVIGLVAAGLEYVEDVKISKEVLLAFIGYTLQLEQSNKAMNIFVAELISKLRSKDIYTLLVKGQGIAQCYKRPLWRANGDVDLFLSNSNYDKAKEILTPMATFVETEGKREKHQGYRIGPWLVELHGSLRCGLSCKMDKVIDGIQSDVFYGGKVRSWMNGQTQVFMPDADCDVVFVFTHFIKHFFIEGLGLRQICDWCRLLYTFKDSLDYGLLEQRIMRAGLVSEWKAFYNLASRYLGMPDLGSGLMVHDSRYDKKADRIMEFILKSGNMGHNRDMSHFSKYPYLIRKCVSMGRRIGDLINHARIFPLDSLRFFPRIMFNGVRSAMRGE